LNIDPNLYVGGGLLLIGIIIGFGLGIARPYLDKRFLRSTAKTPVTPTPQGAQQAQGAPALRQAPQPGGA